MVFQGLSKKQVEKPVDARLFCAHQIVQNVMRTTLLILLISSAVRTSTVAGTPAGTMDSLHVVKPAASHWRLTGRIHSQGIFMFGGRVGSGNPTFDINFTYERKTWGLMFFKGQDFIDHSTFYNFALIALYKNIKINDHLTITPYLGTFLEQANSIADKGSDAVAIITTTYKISHTLTLEEMSLFGNLIIEPQESDWVNRLRLTYASRHLDLIPSLWHNNNVLDHSSYWSAGLNIAYSRVAVAEHLYLSTGITGLVVLQTSDESANPKTNALMLSLSLQWAH
jgi:hypothetical protein